jgi:hypothetical protein
MIRRAFVWAFLNHEVCKMACPKCGSGNFALLSLIWEQGTHVGGVGRVQQSLEAAKLAPPQPVPVARRVVTLIGVALLVGPLMATAAGKGMALLFTAGAALVVGIPLLRDVRWNRVEQPHQRRVWANTFSCRSCGHRWSSGQASAPPTENARMRMAVIAALVVVMIAPALVTRRSAAAPPRTASGALETVYLTGSMNVRSGPGTSFQLIATLQPGAPAYVGPRDANGWSALHAPDGRRIGFLYRNSELIQPYRP